MSQMQRQPVWFPCILKNLCAAGDLEGCAPAATWPQLTCSTLAMMRFLAAVKFRSSGVRPAGARGSLPLLVLALGTLALALP